MIDMVLDGAAVGEGHCAYDHVMEMQSVQVRGGMPPAVPYPSLHRGGMPPAVPVPVGGTGTCNGVRRGARLRPGLLCGVRCAVRQRRV